MEFERITIRVAYAMQLTGFTEYRIRKLIKAGELKTVRVGRAVLINYRHFKACCAQHRKNEIRTQKVVSIRGPKLAPRVID